MMVKSIKRPQLQQFRSLKTWTVIYFEDHERNTRFCWRSLDLCLLCWFAFGYCTAPTSAFLIQGAGRHEASSEVYWDWCGNYQPNLWLLETVYSIQWQSECTIYCIYLILFSFHMRYSSTMLYSFIHCYSSYEEKIKSHYFWCSPKGLHDYVHNAPL